MQKSKKYIIASFLLSFGFALINIYITQYKFLGIGLLSLSSAALFIWCLKDGMGLNATLLTLILPVLFTLGVGLFWFLLPATFYFRIPIIITYGMGIYVLVATMNIYIVSTFRKIALARAAKFAGFVLTLFTGFLLYDAAISLKTSIILTTAVIAIITFLLFIQGLWYSKLSQKIGSKIIIYAVFSAYFISFVATILYFWPISVIGGSIILTVLVYILLGLGQSELEDRLFRQTVRDYITIGLFVFIAMLFLTNWRA
jgi:hypothetical protein